MDARWIILLYVLKIHLKSITPQRHYHHHHYYDDALQQYDDEDDPDESEESSSEYIVRRKMKFRKSADSEECICACETCFSAPKACCAEFCKYCRTDTTGGLGVNQNPYVPQEQKVVFVPFPYPLIVPTQNDDTAKEKLNAEENVTVDDKDRVYRVYPPTTVDITTMTTQSTTSEKPTTTKPSTSKLRSKSVDVGMLSKHRQLKEINPAVKRIRPAWVPKYGIVPIPDHLAAKLMTQLTEVRALKAKRL